jgi:hypothetical protein
LVMKSRRKELMAMSSLVGETSAKTTHFSGKRKDSGGISY